MNYERSAQLAGRHNGIVTGELTETIDTRCHQRGFQSRQTESHLLRVVSRVASFFFEVRAWLVTVLDQFSIIYFMGLGLRIGVRGLGYG